MKPHIHSCPVCAKVWGCRGFTCVERKEFECPECAGEETDFELEDE